MQSKQGRWWLTEGSEDAVIEAPPEQIYALVADLPRMGEWSPECQSVEWVEGATGPAEGARFVGHNRGGPRQLIRWSRRGRVLAAEPGREFTFVTEEGGRESTLWRYRFERVGGDTRVTESYEVKWLPLWARIVDGPLNRRRELREHMQHTLRGAQGSRRGIRDREDHAVTLETPPSATRSAPGEATRRPRTTTTATHRHHGDEARYIPRTISPDQPRRPTMTTTYRAAPDIDVITSSFPIPGMGSVPINAFVLHGPEPVLVDTGAVVEREEFLTTLRSVIDPADLRWIWLTHPDPDHTGALHQLLVENTQLKVITTFLAVGMMSLSAPMPLDRVHLLNPGATITVGPRTLTAIKPPAFDNPCTVGLHDDVSGVLFSSDCFGALLSDVPESASDLSDEELREGQVLWATIDSPWLHRVDHGRLGAALDDIRKMEPTMVLSSHLPAASGDMTDRLLASLAAVPTSPPFVGPDQTALEQMMAQMAAG